MTHTLRLENSDSLAATVIKLADGNRKAGEIVGAIMLRGEENGGTLGALFRLTAIRQFDVLGIYGERIVDLHDKACGSDIARTTAVLDCFHSKLFTADQVHAAIDGTDSLELDTAIASLIGQTRGFHAGFRGEIFGRAA